MKCSECGAEMVVSHEPLTEEYRGEQITVKGLEYQVCPECGEVSMSLEEADKQAREMARVYASRHAILTPAQIKEIRDRLQLTQKQFETIVGVASPSVCRWERGSVQPSASANNVMKLIRDVPGVADYLIAQNGIVRKSERRDQKTARTKFSVVAGGNWHNTSRNASTLAKEG